MVNCEDLKAMKDEGFQPCNGVNDKELKPLKDVDSKPKVDVLESGCGGTEAG
ncbi:hypothetical protein SLEP1_g19302 [Rubroshorea leprosula]|nr:hypothetical protein SLEP1_g19302 [Rubroshorea leprosula]